MIQIIGKGGFAREVKSYIESSDTYGYNGTKKHRIFFFENEEILNATTGPTTYLAIGNGIVRKKIVGGTKLLWYETLNLGKVYGSCHIGTGSIICPGTILTTNIVVGFFVIINLNCTIGHDCIIDDYTTISPGANISGNVKIGKCCYIGTNAVIREKITICDDVVIGAGAVVVKDITEPGTYVGNPCKKLNNENKIN